MTSPVPAARGDQRPRVVLPFGAVTGTTGTSLVLTFDDGPDPDLTPRVLEVLARHDAGATFFVLLTRARRHPDLIRRTLSAGHEIGLHGPDHRSLPSYPYRAARRRTAAARRELEAITGQPVRWFRPPYGDQSTSSFLAVRRAGLQPVMWSATTWDWKDVSPAERREKALGTAAPGGIVLAHDGTADVADAAVPASPVVCDTAALLDELLTEWRRRGIPAVSLGDALRTARPVYSLRFVVPHRRPRR